MPKHICNNYIHIFYWICLYTTNTYFNVVSEYLSGTQIGTFLNSLLFKYIIIKIFIQMDYIILTGSKLYINCMKLLLSLNNVLMFKKKIP